MTIAANLAARLVKACFRTFNGDIGRIILQVNRLAIARPKDSDHHIARQLAAFQCTLRYARCHGISTHRHNATAIAVQHSARIRHCQALVRQRIDARRRVLLLQIPLRVGHLHPGASLQFHGLLRTKLRTGALAFLISEWRRRNQFCHRTRPRLDWSLITGPSLVNNPGHYHQRKRKRHSNRRPNVRTSPPTLPFVIRCFGAAVAHVAHRPNLPVCRARMGNRTWRALRSIDSGFAASAPLPRAPRRGHRKQWSRN